MAIISYDLETFELSPNYCPDCEKEIYGDHVDGDVVCPECGKRGPNYVFFNPNWKDHFPPQVSCASAGFVSKKGETEATHDFMGTPGEAMTLDEVNDMIDKLIEWHEEGHTIVVWNGLHFDWRVLAELTGRYEELGELALDTVDPMFYIVCMKGHRLGLDKSCQGMNVKGKLHEVTLNDGTILEDMAGWQAPELWQRGEVEAVMAYLREDVLSLSRLMNNIVRLGYIAWITQKGVRRTVPMKNLYTNRQCLQLPEPDTDWMDNPPVRVDYMDWMLPYREEA